MTDIEIARNTKLEKINVIAEKVGIEEEELEQYGKYKAKISKGVYERLKNKPDGNMILVTAISPTSLGEGKTTVSIAVADALSKIGKKSILALREPSLGPVFRYKRWSNRWRESTSCTNGRYKFTFYRGYTCNNFSQ